MKNSITYILSEKFHKHKEILIVFSLQILLHKHTQVKSRASSNHAQPEYMGRR